MIEDEDSTNMLEDTVRKSEWKIKQTIAKLILDIGGIIFGGFVRDTLLHDHYAKKYYEKIKDKGYTSSIKDMCYNDESYYPETKDRRVIPNDIDCYIESTEMLAQLESALIRHKFSYHRVFVRQNASDYIPRMNVPDNSLIHIRYKVYCFDRIAKYNLKNTILNLLPAEFRFLCNKHVQECITRIYETSTDVNCVIIDALVKKIPELQIEAPFGNIDFECNALILTKDGIRLSNQLLISHGIVEATARVFKLTQIIQDITEKQAVIARNEHPIDNYRFQKMRLKGWKIITKLELVKEIPNPPPSKYDKEMCIICHDNFEGNFYKLKCCSAKYHKECLLKTIHTGTSAMALTMCCIVCKRKTPSIGIEAILLSYST